MLLDIKTVFEIDRCIPIFHLYGLYPQIWEADYVVVGHTPAGTFSTCERLCSICRGLHSLPSPGGLCQLKRLLLRFQPE